jgi:hypothetical protein
MRAAHQNGDELMVRRRKDVAELASPVATFMLGTVHGICVAAGRDQEGVRSLGAVACIGGFQVWWSLDRLEFIHISAPSPPHPPHPLPLAPRFQGLAQLAVVSLESMAPSDAPPKERSPRIAAFEP